MPGFFVGGPGACAIASGPQNANRLIDLGRGVANTRIIAIPGDANLEEHHDDIDRSP